MRDAEAFFSDVADALPFDEVERAEILEELRAHVADSRAELEGEGLASDVAERVAIDRLGEPDRLVRALTEARRSRRRLVAAAGAGSWAVVSSGIYGWIVGVLLAALAWIATQAVVRFVGPFAFDSVSFIAIGVALYVAGSVVTPVVATRAGYRAETVRRVLALAGTLVLAATRLLAGRDRSRLSASRPGSPCRCGGSPGSRAGRGCSGDRYGRSGVCSSWRSWSPSASSSPSHNSGMWPAGRPTA
jgi:hypothetical protein